MPSLACAPSGTGERVKGLRPRMRHKTSLVNRPIRSAHQCLNVCLTLHRSTHQRQNARLTLRPSERGLTIRDRILKDVTSRDRT